MSELDQIEQFEKQGHTYNCSYRQVYGDGQCECRKDPVKPMTDEHRQGIEFLRSHCRSFQAFEQNIKQLLEDTLSCINVAVYRMRNAETVKEADEAYLDVLRATKKMIEGLSEK